MTISDAGQYGVSRLGIAFRIGSLNSPLEAYTESRRRVTSVRARAQERAGCDRLILKAHERLVQVRARTLEALLNCAGRALLAAHG